MIKDYAAKIDKIIPKVYKFCPQPRTVTKKINYLNILTNFARVARIARDTFLLVVNSRISTPYREYELFSLALYSCSVCKIISYPITII
jgi:hypothetical protein